MLQNQKSVRGVGGGLPEKRAGVLLFLVVKFYTNLVMNSCLQPSSTVLVVF